jgi:uncharacterized damage-inducible protein DinB
MPGYLEQLLDYNCWATGRLLDALAGAPGHVLDATGEGGYGSIRETMTHIFSAERSYVARLSGLGRTEDLEPLDLPGMRAHAAQLRESITALASLLPDPETVYQRQLGPVTAATVLTQLFQHGCEHRAQVTTILGAHGFDLPSLQPWAHGRVLAGLPPLG